MKNKGIVKKYNIFLSDFGYTIDTEEQFLDWNDVVNYPTQKEIPIKEENGEYPQHYKGKRNIVELFTEHNSERNARYLLWTERQQLQERYVKAFGGPRSYRPDIVVFDKIGFSKNKPHYGIYIIEIDGRKNHTNEHEVYKDLVRDEFFFDTYNAVTIRIPTWRAHGKSRIYHEFSDIYEQMEYKSNQMTEDQNRRLGHKK